MGSLIFVSIAGIILIFVDILFVRDIIQRSRVVSNSMIFLIEYDYKRSA